MTLKSEDARTFVEIVEKEVEVRAGASEATLEQKVVPAKIILLTEDDVTKFIRAYSQTYGKVLQRPVAQEFALKLVSLITLCGRATNEDISGSTVACAEQIANGNDNSKS